MQTVTPRRQTDRAVKNRSRNLWRKHPQKFTRKSVSKPVSKEIADLEWQLKFTKMKLGLWRDLDNDKWEYLDQMQKQARASLKEKKLEHRALTGDFG